MHLGFGIPGIQHHHDDENGTSMNQTHNNNSIVDQVIHNLPTHLFTDHHNNSHHHHQFLPISHNYMVEEGAGASSAYYPVNFRLGLNEINSSSNTNERDCNNSINGDGAAGLLIRGSEHYQVPEEARHTCLEMHQHCWHNPQDSTSIKQQKPPFWEPLPAEVSNENSEIIDRLENIKMNQKQPLQSCSNSKTRLVYGEGELEAIYKRCRTSITINQTPDRVLPRGQDQGSDEASIEASVCLKDDRQDNKKKKKKKKRKERGSCNELVQFFEKLVKQVVDHQENLHTKFAERMERLDGERREKEEAWRSRELVYFEQQAAARARENTLAATREDAIVSYLEKITGQNIPILDYWRHV